METLYQNPVVYSLKLLLKNFLGFFIDWYVTFPRLFWIKVGRAARSLNRDLNFTSMLRHWFSPLYQDYSTAGFFIGVFIRTGWIIFDVIFYLIFFLVSLLFFCAWLLFLPALFWLIFANLIYG